jgi:hypothetical protein
VVFVFFVRFVPQPSARLGQVEHPWHALRVFRSFRKHAIEIAAEDRIPIVLRAQRAKDRFLFFVN